MKEWSRSFLRGEEVRISFGQRELEEGNRGAKKQVRYGGFTYCVVRGYFECRLEVCAKIADYK